MSYREAIAVCCHNLTKYRRHGWYNVEYFNVKTDGTYSYHYALNDSHYNPA
jgi:hypothetical protein